MIDLHWVEWNWTDDWSEVGKASHMTTQQVRRCKRLSSRPMSGWQLKLCLRVIWTCCWLQKWHDLDMDTLNTVLSLESSITWAGTMLLTLEFLHEWVVWVLLCRFINVISPTALLSALVLSVFHTCSCHCFIPHQNKLLMLLGCFYPVIPEQVELSSYIL